MRLSLLRPVRIRLHSRQCGQDGRESALLDGGGCHAESESLRSRLEAGQGFM